MGRGGVPEVVYAAIRKRTAAHRAPRSGRGRGARCLDCSPPGPSSPPSPAPAPRAASSGSRLFLLRAMATHYTITYDSEIGRAMGLKPHERELMIPEVQRLSKLCASCGAATGGTNVIELRQCSGENCKVRYCGRTCQKAAWMTHKPRCGAPLPTGISIESLEASEVCDIMSEWGQIDPLLYSPALLA